MTTTTVSTSSVFALNSPFACNFFQVDTAVPSGGPTIVSGIGIAQSNSTVGPTQQVGTSVDTNIGLLTYGCAAGTLVVGNLHYFPNDATYGLYTGTILPATASVSALGPQLVGTPLSVLTAGQFGWYWVGSGVWNIYVQTSVTALSQLTATSTAGQSGTGGVKIGASNLDTTTAGALQRVLAPTVMMVNQAFT